MTKPVRGFAVLPENLLDRVRRTLEDSIHLQKTKVSVEDDDGVLVLQGHATSYYLKQMAQEAIRPLLDEYDPRPMLRNLIEVGHS